MHLTHNRQLIIQQRKRFRSLNRRPIILRYPQTYQRSSEPQKANTLIIRLRRRRTRNHRLHSTRCYPPHLRSDILICRKLGEVHESISTEALAEGFFGAVVDGYYAGADRFGELDSEVAETAPRASDEDPVAVFGVGAFEGCVDSDAAAHLGD